MLHRSLVLAAAITALVSRVWAGSVTVEQKRVSAGGKSFSVRVARAPLDSYKVKIGLAQGRVGMTQSLAGIAKRHGAAAAINGCFFDAYVSGPIKVPWHNLVTGGEVVHIGDTGTTLGFDSSGDYRMDRVRIRIRGELGGQSNWASNWYAYLVNHTGSAAIFNHYYASRWTPAGGAQVLIQDGSVKEVGYGSKQIPSGGYVLAFAGGETSLANRFRQGDKCAFKLAFEGARDQEFWNRVWEAIGCGPSLVKQGQVCYDPGSEGFSHPKIMSLSGARSAIGVTQSKQLLLVTTSCTVRQLADVMKALGAYDAINLDGGASSGLYANGKSLLTPGRLISNAVVVVKR